MAAESEESPALRATSTMRSGSALKYVNELPMKSTCACGGGSCDSSRQAADAASSRRVQVSLRCRNEMAHLALGVCATVRISRAPGVDMAMPGIPATLWRDPKQKM